MRHRAFRSFRGKAFSRMVVSRQEGANMNDAITKARQALKTIREEEAQLIHLVCPKCGQWIDVVTGAQALCGPCDRVMKVGK